MKKENIEFKDVTTKISCVDCKTWCDFIGSDGMDETTKEIYFCPNCKRKIMLQLEYKL